MVLGLILFIILHVSSSVVTRGSNAILSTRYAKSHRRKARDLCLRGIGHGDDDSLLGIEKLALLLKRHYGFQFDNIEHGFESKATRGSNVVLSAICAKRHRRKACDLCPRGIADRVFGDNYRGIICRELLDCDGGCQLYRLEHGFESNAITGAHQNPENDEQPVLANSHTNGTFFQQIKDILKILFNYLLEYLFKEIQKKLFNYLLNYVLTYLPGNFIIY